jgi:hypothetical protein
MKKFEELSKGLFNEKIEIALNKAINKLDIEEEIVFEEITVKLKTPIPDGCRKELTCRINSKGQKVCRWKIICK